MSLNWLRRLFGIPVPPSDDVLRFFKAAAQEETRKHFAARRQQRGL